MADDVVDIRKRIQEMRNEVSAAIVSSQELEDTTYAVCLLYTSDAADE